MEVQRGTITKQEINDFLESHGILHSRQVTFDVTGYKVHSFRRDEDGKYILSKEHPGMPIEDVEDFVYGN